MTTNVHAQPPEPARLHRLDALCRLLGTRPDLVRRLEKGRLIAPAGRDSARKPLYDGEGRRRLERVRELLQAGYAERDIAAVLGLVEERDDHTRETWLTTTDIIAPPRNAAAEIARAVDLGLVAVAALRDDDVPLFSAASSGRIACVLDLIELGLSAEARELADTPADRPVPGPIALRLRESVEIKRLAAARLARTIDTLTAPRPRRTLLRVRRRPPTGSAAGPTES